MTELHGEGAGREEHTFAVFTGGDGLRFGDVGDDGLRDDAKKRHRNGGHDADDEAKDIGDDATLFRNDARNAGQTGEEVSDGKADEAKDDKFLLTKLLDEVSDEGVADGGEQGHDTHEDGDHEFRQVHGDFDVEGKARLEQSHADPISDVRTDEGAEIAVFEGRGEGTEHVGLARLGVDEVFFFKRESRNQHGDDGDDGQDDEDDTVAPRETDGAFEHAGEQEWGVGKEGSAKVGQRDERGDVHTVFLGLAEFGDEGVIGGAVHRHEQIEQDDEDADPRDIDAADGFHRCAEEQDGDHREGDCAPAHEGNSATEFALAAVGERGDHRVGDGVENPR